MIVPVIPGLGPEWTFPDPTFPTAAPIIIRPYRLIPPPVRTTPEDCPNKPIDLRSWGHGSGRTVPDLWETLYGECLFPKPEDEDDMRLSLEAANKARRSEYARRMKELAHFQGPELESELRSLKAEGLSEDLTWEQFCKDSGGHLSNCLRAKWAKTHGYNLNEIGPHDRPLNGQLWRKDPDVFLRWIERNCRIVQSSSRQYPGLVYGDSSGIRIHGWQTSMALLAKVRAVMEFPNGERVFLSGYQESSPRADELQEMATMELVPFLPTASVVVAQGSPVAATGDPASQDTVPRSPRWTIQQIPGRGMTAKVWAPGDAFPEAFRVPESLRQILQFLSQAKDCATTWVELGENGMIRGKVALNGTRKPTLQRMPLYKKLIDLKILNVNELGLGFAVRPDLENPPKS